MNAGGEWKNEQYLDRTKDANRSGRCVTAGVSICDGGGGMYQDPGARRDMEEHWGGIAIIVLGSPITFALLMGIIVVVILIMIWLVFLKELAERIGCEKYRHIDL